MCYGTRVIKTAEQLEFYFDVERILGDLSPKTELTYNYANGFAHPNMWVIPQEKPKNMIPVKWGLIPHYKQGADASEYYKETIKYGSGLNARSEKLFDSNMYKKSALTRRCIIPVDGFYEPHTAKKEGKDFKIPFYFERSNKDPFNLAGIYTVTPDKLVTFTILTKEATPLFAKIHNKKFRRPVILQDNDVEVWLNNNLKETDVLNTIEDDLPDSEMNAYPISKDLYKRGSDSDRENIIDKVEYEEITINY